ncbi:MAG: ribosome silencing factor [Bacteroidales bacterium]|nr:ribosome silencing factor [Bacteroidales bacterium]
MPKRTAKTNNNLIENNTLTLRKLIVSALETKKGEDITEMNFPDNLGMLFDTFVICSATSNIHANALCEHVVKSIKEQLNITPNHTEGEVNAQWILIDYFHVIVHIFLKEKREFYDLENLWNDTASIIRTTN